MYNARVLEHFANPHHQGETSDADVVGQAGVRGEGPFMTIGLRLKSGLQREQAAQQEDGNGTQQIEEAWFSTYGCPAAVACGSWLTKWVEGKTTDAVLVVEAKDVAVMVGGLPLGKEHCA